MNKKKNVGRRIILMMLGVFLISVSVAGFRLSSFGVDAFTGMNLGISKFIDWSFGSWQLVANAAILVVVIFTVRQCIGIGTVVNMVFVGYIADFICWMVSDVMKLEVEMPVRIVILILALVFASMGVALYMTADMGIAPYDSVAFIIKKVSKERIPFQIARITSDVTALLIGVCFCVAAGNNVWVIVGAGTICNALFNGPMIQFFKNKLA